MTDLHIILECVNIICNTIALIALAYISAKFGRNGRPPGR